LSKDVKEPKGRGGEMNGSEVLLALFRQQQDESEEKIQENYDRIFKKNRIYHP